MITKDELPSSTIAQHWEQFERIDMAPQAPDVQRHEMRRAFYAGAVSAIGIITAFDSPRSHLHARGELYLRLLNEMQKYLEDALAAAGGTVQ